MEFTGERCILEKSGALLEKEHLDRYFFAVDFVKDKNVLDIACGSGYGTNILAGNATKVLGVDISDESIEYAKNNFNKENITFKKGDASNLDFIEDETFDIVVSYETIEHLENYKGFLSEIKRVLKKGGLFIVSTPNKRKSSPNSEKPINHFHVIEFYKDEFVSLLGNYLNIEEIYGQDLFTPIIRLKNIIIKMGFRIAYGRKFKVFYENYLSKRLGKITKENIEHCRYFIAICKK